MVPLPSPSRTQRLAALAVVLSVALSGCVGGDDEPEPTTGPSAADLGGNEATPSGSGSSSGTPAPSAKPNRPPPPPPYNFSDTGPAGPLVSLTHDWTVEENWTRIYILFHLTGSPAAAAIRPDVFISANEDEVCDVGTPVQVSQTDVVMTMLHATQAKGKVDWDSIGQCSGDYPAGAWRFEGTVSLAAGNWELLIQIDY